MNKFAYGAIAFGALIAEPAQARLFKLVDLGIPTGAVGSEATSADSSIVGNAIFSISGQYLRRPVYFGTYPFTPGTYDGALNVYARGGGGPAFIGVTATYASRQDAAIDFGSGGVSVLTPLAGYASGGLLGFSHGALPVGYSLGTGSLGQDAINPLPLDPTLGRQQATAWIQSAGVDQPVALAGVAGETANSLAYAVDGFNIAGAYRALGRPSQAALWANDARYSYTTGPLTLLKTPSGLGDAYATAVDFFGPAVVGEALDGVRKQALYWKSAASDAVRLPDLAGSAGSIVKAAQSGYNFLVGQSLGNGSQLSQAVIWTESSPGQFKVEPIAPHVVNVKGWTITDLTLGMVGSAIAADGTMHAVSLMNYDPQSSLFAGASHSAGPGLGQESDRLKSNDFSVMEQNSFDAPGGGCQSSGSFAFTPGAFVSSRPGNPKSGATVAAGDIAGVRSGALGNTSCYASIGYGQMTFNLAKAGQEVSYLGFEWSSIDAYNNITFYDGLNGTGSAIYISGFGDNSTITGAEVMRLLQLQNDANGRAPDSFVNFTFSGEHVGSVVFSSWDNTAFEFDNVTLGYRAAPAMANALAAVPEPASPAVLGLGAALLAAVRRRGRG